MFDNKNLIMSRVIKVLKCLSLFTLIVIITTCAPSKKNSSVDRRKSGSQVNASQLGRNKYYFSPGYQKKLKSNYKRK
jgi:hypothetical protein